MHTFYLVRHGQKQSNPGEPELTELGHKQAKLVAAHLKLYPIQRVVTSPALRTQQTAKYIADLFQLSIELDQRLRERANWGDDPDQSFEEFLKMWFQSSTHRTYQPPIGDSSLQAGKRIEQVVSDVQTQNQVQHTALITHGGVIADFLRNLFGDERLQQLIRTYKIGYGHHIDECSLTVVTFDNNGPQLVELATTEHLRSLSPRSIISK